MHLPDPDRQPEFYTGVPLKRLLAWIIDMVLIVGLAVLIIPFTAFTGLFFFPALVAIIGFLYRLITLTGGSATWGMRFAGIELRTAAGQRLDLSAAFLHTLGYTVSLTIAPLQLVSVAMMLLTDRGQGLSDMVLNTAMLNRRAAVHLT
ncbi:MAG: RDD family protein [Pseudomonadota bacterium]